MARKNTKPTPNGEKFMAGTPTGDIQKALKAEQKSGGHAKAILVLLACLWRRDGEAGEAIARRLGKNAGTAYGLLSRMHDGGLGARYGRNKPGRPGKIDPKLHGSISNAIDGKPEGCGVKSNAWAGSF